LRLIFPAHISFFLSNSACAHTGAMMKKTDATPQSILSDQLALCTEALRDCFESARAVRAAEDEYGHRKSRELNSAIAILKACAEVGTSLAKINGEFRQDITVRREKEKEGEGGAEARGSNGRGRNG
jgi:hypothetical protein